MITSENNANPQTLCPRFGMLAIEMGFVTVDQIREAMAEQLEDDLAEKPRRLLGTILVDKGWLTFREVEMILDRKEGITTTPHHHYCPHCRVLQETLPPTASPSAVLRCAGCGFPVESALPADNQPPANTSTHGIRILCIDDDALFRALIKDILENAGYTVLLATDGASGLRLAETHQPHLVLLDLVLPGPDGFTICAGFKRKPTLAHIPIVILTRLNNPDLNPRAFQAGALLALQKTASPRTVLHTIQTALSLARKGAATSQISQGDPA
jgi:CheY-like chemotaxis protein